MALSDLQAGHAAGADIEGGVLLAARVVELLVLLVFPIMLARLAAENPFCELTGTWMTSVELPRKFAFIAEPDAVVAQLESKPDQLFSILEGVPPEDSERFAIATLYRGGADPYMSIDNVTIDRSGKNEKKTTRNIVRYLRLAGADADRIVAAAGEDAGEAPDPPELLEAIEHLQADRFEAALAGAMDHIAAGRTNLRIDALRLCALACARLERWEESLGYWKGLFELEPTAFNGQQVGASYAMTGDAAQGKEWIARARDINAGTREVPDLQIVTNFITALTRSGQLEEALPYLEQVRNIYTSVGITDSTFLFVRQIPFLSVFLDNSLPVIRSVLGQEAGRAWFATMLPSLDQEGQEALTVWLGEHFSMSRAGSPV